MANTPAPTALLSDSSNRVESETPTADPFYHSPPSSSVDGAPDSPSLTSLMAAIRKVQQVSAHLISLGVSHPCGHFHSHNIGMHHRKLHH